MRAVKIFLLLLLIAVILQTCKTEPIKVYDSVENMIDEATVKAEYIDVEMLKRMIENDHEFVFVDCRQPEVYIEGHIPGSVNIPRGILEFSDIISNRRLPVYIYCNDCKKSVLAAKSLELLEYPVVMVIKGGWKKWKETYPELIEIGKDSAAEVKFQVAVQDWAF
jgi:rhodanese-related sulfurtransferase